MSSTPVFDAVAARLDRTTGAAGAPAAGASTATDTRRIWDIPVAVDRYERIGQPTAPAGHRDAGTTSPEDASGSRW